MQFSKSDTLDELRYEIGRCGDQNLNTISFIEHVNNLITANNPLYRSSHVYLCKDLAFTLLAHSGHVEPEQDVQFGNNDLSLCAIRGECQTFEYGDWVKICFPCYHGHHLLGILVIYTDQYHLFDQDDYDFFSEVMTYVKNRLI
ncbi:hypothetical protein [Caldalkalibacillus salinus]|uniref:hypothetical protein n=1 Tax=Caldalkalibacillus salinus TaxID=2803787 RepID=UPI001921D95B|nr:hypothetical protein [Caldalkalibacillus salinus]